MDALPEVLPLVRFWSVPWAEREPLLLEAVAATHAWHYARNNAYRRAVSARGVGPAATSADLPRLLRPTAQTFKSYIDVIGTPFPQDRPQAFLGWLADQLSIDLPRERFAGFRSRYGSMEALLSDVERIFADLHLELSTSSGTSGRFTVMARDQEAIERTTESFYLSFQRYLGMRAEHRTILVMPRATRIAMARMATFSVRQVGLRSDRTHLTIPFPAQPDQVRVRSGQTYRPGLEGILERRVLHPFMNWMNDHYVTPKAVGLTLELLLRAEAAGEKALLFGSWLHLHALARELQARGRVLRLPAGSLVGSGGGLKERYAFTPAQIRADLQRAITLAHGQMVPIHDVYGMAEGNWAAMQCRHGSYHIPPWVLAVTLDGDGRLQQQADSTGLLAFFDPYGGGKLFPAFFRSADRVRLINGLGSGADVIPCPCGEVGAYIAEDSIRRVDLLDEAGCAAQV